MESCKKQFDSLELLDLEEDAVQAEVDNLETCTQYVALGRTLGEMICFKLNNILSPEQDLKAKVFCYKRFFGQGRSLGRLNHLWHFPTSEESLPGG